APLGVAECESMISTSVADAEPAMSHSVGGSARRFKLPLGEELFPQEFSDRVPLGGSRGEVNRHGLDGPRRFYAEFDGDLRIERNLPAGAQSQFLLDAW